MEQEGCAGSAFCQRSNALSNFPARIRNRFQQQQSTGKLRCPSAKVDASVRATTRCVNRKTFDTTGETLKHRGQFRTENEYGNAKWLSTPFRANPHSWRVALFFWLRQTDRKTLPGIGVPVRVPGRSGCAHPTDVRRIDFPHRRAGNQRRRKIPVATERVVWPVAADL